MNTEILENLSAIKVETPVDKIIHQIKNLMTSGALNPGDKLPSERQLSERFGVGRTHVRDALRKLEFYGILKTLPQSGTIVAGHGIVALEGLISDVLRLEGQDFHSLVETRVILETNAAKYAALRRTDNDIISIKKSLKAYEDALEKKNSTIEKDLLFHLSIAQASKNSALHSLMLIITPDILTYFKKNDVCSGNKPLTALEDHHIILNHIIDGNSDLAEQAMHSHLNEILNFANDNLKPQK